MGTSNSFGGPSGSTPLVPSWLGDSDTPPPPDDNNQEEQQSDGDANNSEDIAEAPRPVEIESPPAGRFQSARGNFTRFAKSGGSDGKALRRAISDYISTSSGGPRNATTRMGSSKSVARGLVTFLNGVRTSGVQATLAAFRLSDLIGKSISEIFIGLADVICPDGGSVDEGIARNAFVETIVELSEAGVNDLDNLTDDQFRLVVEIFITNTIEARLCNDIGTKICVAPENIPQIENVQDQLRDFIGRGVTDSLDKYSGDLSGFTSESTNNLIDEIYNEAFSILLSISESES